MGMGESDLAAYAATARQWLAEHAAQYRRVDGQAARAATGDEAVRFAEARQFQKLLHAAGYAGIAVPPEYGGQGLSEAHQRAFETEASHYQLPNDRLGVSVNIVGETLLACASDEQRAAHLPKILSGEEVWLQLLSEPSAGSDLASLVTRATLVDHLYVLNGEKTWSTGAAYADYALCTARTDWSVPKHQGITVFIVDMHSTGMEVRPIKQIDGGMEFFQEYLTDVQVPATNVVGALNGGWTVVRRLLEIEHKWSGRRPSGRRATGDVKGLIALSRERGRTGDPIARRLIASIHVQLRAHELLAARISKEIAARRLDPSYGALLKISSDALLQRRAEAALRLAGARAVAWASGDDAGGRAAVAFLNSRSASIAGGTTEIQRNNFSERGLGLPREASPDRELPFDEVQHN